VRDHSSHDAGQFHQVCDPEQRAALPYDDLRIGGDGVRPSRRNGTDCAIIEAQQQAPAVPVVSLADTDGRLSAERMKGVRYKNLMCGGEGNVRILR
jgi:hypothetical protein